MYQIYKECNWKIIRLNTTERYSTITSNYKNITDFLQ